MSPPRIILTDAAGLAENADPAFLILDITRHEIEAGNIASVLDRLHVLTDTRIAVLHYRECLTFQVGGYDTDARELPEIAEVRSYFRRLVQEWPHWLWFLFRGNGGIALLLSLLCQVRVIRGAGGDFGTEFLDVDEMRGKLRDILHRGNALFAAYDIPASDATESATTAVGEVLR